MRLFLTKEGKGKSTMALTLFFVVIGFAIVMLAVNFLLTDPLHALISLSNQTAETLLQSTIISLIGTGICCLLFLLPEKKIVPYGFAGLLVLLLMFLVASFELPTERRGMMQYLILLYFGLPTLLGNIIALTIYKLRFGK